MLRCAGACVRFESRASGSFLFRAPGADNEKKRAPTRQQHHTTNSPIGMIQGLIDLVRAELAAASTFELIVLTLLLMIAFKLLTSILEEWRTPLPAKEDVLPPKRVVPEPRPISRDELARCNGRAGVTTPAPAARRRMLSTLHCRSSKRSPPNRKRRKDLALHQRTHFRRLEQTKLLWVSWTDSSLTRAKGSNEKEKQNKQTHTHTKTPKDFHGFFFLLFVCLFFLFCFGFLFFNIFYFCVLTLTLFLASR